MADWKTYAKAARNTARKQAPEVKRSAQESVRRGSRRTGDYVRAAGRVVEQSRGDDESTEVRAHDGERPPESTARGESGERPPESRTRREYDPRPEEDPRPEQVPRPEQDPAGARDPAAPHDRRPEENRGPDGSRGSDRERRPAIDTDGLRRGAAAYYTVAERRVRRAQLVPRIMRSVRDALLIGLSIFAIWVVLAAAGLQIPLSAVLVAVGVIVLISFGTSLYASSKRAQDAEHADDDERSADHTSEVR